MDRCHAHQLPRFVASPQNIGFCSGALIINRHCACLSRINDTACFRSGAAVGASVEPIAECPKMESVTTIRIPREGQCLHERTPLVVNGNSPGRPIVVARQRRQARPPRWTRRRNLAQLPEAHIPLGGTRQPGTKPQIAGYPMLNGGPPHERGRMATRRVRRRDESERLPRLHALFDVLSAVFCSSWLLPIRFARYPKGSRPARYHSWRDSQPLMNADEVVVHHVKGDRAWFSSFFEKLFVSLVVRRPHDPANTPRAGRRGDRVRKRSGRPPLRACGAPAPARS
jgi:hypothetical protein